MIITRTPFRASFAGGGTDLKEFYSRSPGCVLSTTINKYIYVSIHPFFNKNQISLKYSRTELVDSAEELQHPIAKEALKYLGMRGGVEITSTADIPAGTGLGSSSSYTVGLLHALYSYGGKFVSKERLAREACKIEIERLGEPIGKQDQYAAAYGNFNFIRFNTDESVSVEPLLLSKKVIDELRKSMLLFYTGDSRSASQILSKQKEATGEKRNLESLGRMAALAEELRDSLRAEDLSRFGEVLHKGWLLKKTLASGISNQGIDRHYELALKNGAVGGKLLGAGGGGFLLLYCQENAQAAVRQALRDLREIRFSFDTEGTKIVYVGEKDWED